MERIFLSFFSIIITLGIISNTAYGDDYPKKNHNVKEIADFLGIDTQHISMECPQNSFGIRGSGAEKNLFFCLDHDDKEKRCELSISGLDEPPAQYQIKFDIKLDKASPSDRWHSIMQIHSFPDFGEKWRCPPLSVEVNKGNFRAYSRWDKSQISKTTGYNCSERDSSITSKELINYAPVKYGEWNKFIFDIHATYMNDGFIKIKINELSSELKNRGNLYNDKKAPYLKLGVYKPAGWSNAEIKNGSPVCVSYRNFSLSTSKEK